MARARAGRGAAGRGAAGARAARAPAVAAARGRRAASSGAPRPAKSPARVGSRDTHPQPGTMNCLNLMHHPHRLLLQYQRRSLLDLLRE